MDSPATAGAAGANPRRRSNTKAKRKSKADMDIDGSLDGDAVTVDGKGRNNTWSAEVKEVEKPGKPGETTYEIELTEVVDGDKVKSIVRDITCLNCQKLIE